MPYEISSQMDEKTQSTNRPLPTSIWRGVRGKCPSCGEGAVFESGLSIIAQCSVCHENLFHHRADDLPAYLNVFITGHIVVAAMMLIFIAGWFSTWTLMALSIAAAIILAVGLLRPLKGLVVGAQWALRMHGFDENNNERHDA